MRVSIAAMISFLLAAVAALAVAAPASASGGSLTPYVDCVSVSGTGANTIYTAYFGYDSTEPVAFNFPVGDNNETVPGLQDQGQPTTFNVGNYPRVFAAQFDGMFITSISWILDGQIATASATSQPCTVGTTDPASVVGSTVANLNGTVTPEGIDTTYQFDYGVTPALGQSTPPDDAGSGTEPVVVQASLTGLVPATKYYFQLDATNSFGNTLGAVQTFTTLPALSVTTQTLPGATVGSGYSQQLAATGGSDPYAWSLATGSGPLPPGLSISPSGVIAGTTTEAGTFAFVAQATDSSTPSSQSATADLSITVAKAVQAITFTSSPPAVAATGARYAVSATGGTSGNPVTFSIGAGSTAGACTVAVATVSFTGPGTCVIDADQAGNADYLPAPESSQTVTIGARPVFVLDSPAATFDPGQPYSYTFVATGEPVPSYALAAGAPQWLSIDPVSGLLEGTPPAGTLTFKFTVAGSNRAGDVTAGPFTVTIATVSIALTCPSTATVDHDVTCWLTAHSTAPVAATDLALSIALPPRSSLVRVSARGKRKNHTVSWARESFAPGASARFGVTFAGDRVGKLTLIAHASFDYLGSRFSQSAQTTIVERRVR